MRSWCPSLVLITTLMLCVGFVRVTEAMGLGFTTNLTPSMPRGIYLLSRIDELKRGDIVMFPIPEELLDFAKRTSWLRADQSLLKTVVALPGDRICVLSSGVFINGKLLGPVYSKDSLGEKLPEKSGCREVPEGKFFPFSNYPRSFDGRYIGEVPIADISFRATPLILF